MSKLKRGRYPVVLAALFLFVLVKLVLAAGGSACVLEMRTAGHWVYDIMFQKWRWEDDGPTTFACVNNGCTGTCPAAPTVLYYNANDYNDDGIVDEQWVYKCPCSTSDDPIGSFGAYCKGLGRKYVFGGGLGTEYELQCLPVGTCINCTTKIELPPTPDPGQPGNGTKKEWCECP